MIANMCGKQLQSHFGPHVAMLNRMKELERTINRQNMKIGCRKVDAPPAIKLAKKEEEESTWTSLPRWELKPKIKGEVQ